METRLRLAPILTALCLALPASAQEAGLRLLDHGVICQVTSEGTIAAPQTEQGRLNLIAQDRDIQIENVRITARSLFLVDTRWAAGKYDSLELMTGQLLAARIAFEDFAIDVMFPYATGDQLRVLRTEV